MCLFYFINYVLGRGYQLVSPPSDIRISWVVNYHLDASKFTVLNLSKDIWIYYFVLIVWSDVGEMLIGPGT